MFESLVKNRHSAMNFEENLKMNEADFKSIMELVKLAPSTYNLQSTEYLVVDDQNIKDKICELSSHQYKLKTCSGIVYVLGNKNSLTTEYAERIYAPMKMLKMISEADYDTLMNQITGWSTQLLQDKNAVTAELLRVGGISAAFFILSAESKGYNTCPMHILNEPEIRKLLNVPEHLELLMMIAIGMATDKKRPRGYRKPLGELIRFNTF